MEETRSSREEALRKASFDRSESAWERTIRAIEALRDRGEEVNVSSVAREAGVSRNYVYTQPEIRNLVEALRAAAPRGSSGPTKDTQIAALKLRVRQLEKELREASEQDPAGLRTRAERAEAESARLSAELAGARAEVSELRKQLRAAYDWARV